MSLCSRHGILISCRHSSLLWTKDLSTVLRLAGTSPVWASFTCNRSGGSLIFQPSPNEMNGLLTSANLPIGCVITEPRRQYRHHTDDLQFSLTRSTASLRTSAQQMIGHSDLALASGSVRSAVILLNRPGLRHRQQGLRQIAAGTGSDLRQLVALLALARAIGAGTPSKRLLFATQLRLPQRRKFEELSHRVDAATCFESAPDPA